MSDEDYIIQELLKSKYTYIYIAGIIVMLKILSSVS